MASIEYVVRAVDDMSATLAKISKSVDSLRGNLDELGKKKATPAVELEDKAFAAKYDSVKARLDALSKRAAAARVDANTKDADAKLAAIQVRLDSIGRKVASPRVKIDGLDRAEAQLLALDVSLDKVGKRAEKTATGGIADLIGSGSGHVSAGIAGLVAVGAALSPVIATVGTGLGGLALAAYGAVKPIEAAAQKTGGLRANMAKLNPEQRALAGSVLGLQKQYSAFEKALQPQVLSVFGKGIELAGRLMRAVQPVAAATGKAIGGFLDRVDAEFASGTWKSFFSWMSAQVGPDIKLIGTSIVDLLDALPALLQSLQPVAVQLLQFVDDGAKLIDIASRVNLRVQSLGHTANTSGGFLGMLAGAAKQAFNELAPGVQGSRELEHWLGKLGSTTNTAAAAQLELNQRVAASHAATADLIHPLGQVATGMTAAKNSALKEKDAVQQLTTALNIMNSGLLTTQQDQVTWRQAQQAATKAIDANKHSLDSNRASALAARAAIIQSTVSALQFANQESKTSGGVKSASRTLQDQINWLKQHAGHSKIAAAEIDALRQALQKLKNAGNVNTHVTVSGTGSWQSDTAGGKHVGRPGFAAGGRVGPPGASGGGDRRLILAEDGEVVVPLRMVNAGVVDHLRGHLPGFAAGGIVGSYSGSPRGLGPWSQHNWAATIRMEIADIAKAMAHAFMRAVSSSGFGTPGPGGGAPAANAALARRMMPAWGSGAEWAAWNYVGMRESGWSQFARNPSSGAYGIPQALPPGKMGPAANPPQSNPAAQISWMIGYIRSRYGDPIGAAAHERSFNWYRRGFHGVVSSPTVFGAGEAGPERVDVTPVGRSYGGTVNINVHVSADASMHPAETGRVIADRVKAYLKRGGSLYPSGMTPR